MPVGAVLTRKAIFEKMFNRMDRAVVHGSTFGKNDLAMAAGLATLEVIEAEGLILRPRRQARGFSPPSKPWESAMNSCMPCAEKVS